MQVIAREMNFSESTFLMPAERSDTDIRMRIFTPNVEMPMAGHPTVGSTFALAHAGVIAPGRSRFVFGLNVGPVPVDRAFGDIHDFVAANPDEVITGTVTTITPGMPTTMTIILRIAIAPDAVTTRPGTPKRVQARSASHVARRLAARPSVRPGPRSRVSDATPPIGTERKYARYSDRCSL